MDYHLKDNQYLSLHHIGFKNVNLSRNAQQPTISTKTASNQKKNILPLSSIQFKLQNIFKSIKPILPWPTEW